MPSNVIFFVHSKAALLSKVINKKFTLKKNSGDNTLNAIFQVLAWSFRILAHGTFPAKDHEGLDFTHPWRKKHATNALKIFGLLSEIRGDWEMYKNVFNLKGWNDPNCCFRCFASKQDILQCDSNATWRQQRKTTFQHFEQCCSNNVPVSALFSCPGVSLSSFQIDWLHAVDLGVCCDFLGNLMYHVLDKYPGTSQQQRCSAMFRHMQSFYRSASPCNQLDNLTPLMLRKQSKKTSTMGSPKQRASAGEAKALVPFGLVIARLHLQKDDLLESTILAAAEKLNSCYECLSREKFQQELLALKCKEFCVLYSSVSRHFSDGEKKLWVFKPKFHLFQELCEFQGGNPCLHWTYRDEDCGGSIAHTARRRGGANTCLSLSTNMLMKFMGQQLVPQWPAES